MKISGINAAGKIAFVTQTKITAKMVSDWVQNAAKSDSGTIVDMAILKAQGLTGGEVASIVIGSIIGAVTIIMAVIFTIRQIVGYSRMSVMVPKMM